jgi:hypothetical protein
MLKREFVPSGIGEQFVQELYSVRPANEELNTTGIAHEIGLAVLVGAPFESFDT